jgi:hypothetical protein
VQAHCSILHVLPEVVHPNADVFHAQPHLGRLISNAPKLSLNTLQWTIGGFCVIVQHSLVLVLLNSCIRLITVRKLSESALYSASVVDRGTSRAAWTPTPWDTLHTSPHSQSWIWLWPIKMRVDLIPISHKVRIDKAAKVVAPQVEDQSLISCSHQLAPYLLDGCHVGLPRVCSKPCTLVHRIGDIQAGGLLHKIEFAHDATKIPLFFEVWFPADISMQPRGGGCWSLLGLCPVIHTNVAQDLVVNPGSGTS